MVPQAKFSRGIVWEFLDTAGGDKIATHVFKAQYIFGQKALRPLVMAIRVVEFSNRGYKIRKSFA